MQSVGWRGRGRREEQRTRRVARVSGRKRTDRVELAESVFDSCFSFYTSHKPVQFRKICTGLWEVQKLKQLLHSDSDGVGTSVCSRPMVHPTFYGHCTKPLALAEHGLTRC